VQNAKPNKNEKGLAQTSPCGECNEIITGSVISTKELIALNQKLVGRAPKFYLCEDCLADFADCDKEEFPEMIENFRDQGCELF
jgi:hypothetical protein